MLGLYPRLNWPGTLKGVADVGLEQRIDSLMQPHSSLLSPRYAKAAACLESSTGCVVARPSLVG